MLKNLAYYGRSDEEGVQLLKLTNHIARQPLDALSRANKELQLWKIF